MDDVVTDLDRRFSEPDAEPTTWDAAVQVLIDAEISWLTTVRADGRPHVTPLVAVWHAGRLHFGTGPDEQKSRNLAANQQVVVTTGCNDWERGLDVVVEGRAERVTDRAQLEALASAWRSKWDGSWRFEVDGDGFRNDIGGLAHVWAVEAQKVLAFAKGTFGVTRHRPAPSPAGSGPPDGPART